jgi:hypothetical protein
MTHLTYGLRRIGLLHELGRRRLSGRTIALGWNWTLVQVTAGISAEFAALTACDGRHTLN